MDPSPSPVQTTQPTQQQQDDDIDEWDTDNFVIPSLVVEDDGNYNDGAPKVEAAKPHSLKDKKEENIYLGPHGAPPSLSKQQDVNPSSRKQKLKQKLKEADRKLSGTGRENKLDNLRELVGGGKGSSGMEKGTSRDWLDPHCHESEFEKWHPQ